MEKFGCKEECVPPPIVNTYTIVGSTEPVVGPSFFNDYCVGQGLDPIDDKEEFGQCLTTESAGPVIISDSGGPPDPTRFWYFNRDEPFDAKNAAACLANPKCYNAAQFAFEGDEVCAEIITDILSSKSGFELWAAQYIDMPLGQFERVSSYIMCCVRIHIT